MYADGKYGVVLCRSSPTRGGEWSREFVGRTQHTFDVSLQFERYGNIPIPIWHVMQWKMHKVYSVCESVLPAPFYVTHVCNAIINQIKIDKLSMACHRLHRMDCVFACPAVRIGSPGCTSASASGLFIKMNCRSCASCARRITAT